MDKQAIFNQVAAHLIKQNKKSMAVVEGHYSTELQCAYRSVDENGNVLKCAIGCLIPDEFYYKAMEGVIVPAIVNRYYALRKHLDIANIDNDYQENQQDISFLAGLQTIHDLHKPKHWRDKLASFAERFELSFEQ